MDYLKQELGRLYAPRHLVHCADGLPRTDSDKPDQPRLRQLAARVAGGSGPGDAAAGGAAPSAVVMGGKVI